MIRTTITPAEFEKLTWTSFDSIASDINDVDVLRNGNTVSISVLDYEINSMSVDQYNSILNNK